MRLPNRTTTGLAIWLTAALLSLGAAAAPATAATATAATSPASRPPAPGGWERFHAQSFDAAAGTLCPFDLHSEVLFDQEYVRTTATFPGGKPQTQEYVGPLVVQITNTDSGQSVDRDLSGRAIVDYQPDGGYDFRIQGPAAIGFHPGDSLPPGYYVLTGEHVVHFAADGSRTLLIDHGDEENVCMTLA